MEAKSFRETERAVNIRRRVPFFRTRPLLVSQDGKPTFTIPLCDLIDQSRPMFPRIR